MAAVTILTVHGMSVDHLIQYRMRVKKGDTSPYVGWNANREVLAKILGELEFNAGAEIGVRSGVYSEVLCQANPKLKLKCVDIWKGFSKTTTDEKAEGFYRKALQRLTQYGVEFMKMNSTDAAKLVPDGSLDFVYIDACHEFDMVMMDILTWVPKVKIGGIVAGHDYVKLYQVGVITAVNAYVEAHDIHPWYATWELCPTWLWVKK